MLPQGLYDCMRFFCQLVKNHSLKGYSAYVGQLITQVQYDLTADLKLTTLARQLNVNASYLSELFHQEVGMTATDDIRQERISHGIRLFKGQTGLPRGSTGRSFINDKKSGGPCLFTGRRFPMWLGYAHSASRFSPSLLPERNRISPLRNS